MLDIVKTSFRKLLTFCEEEGFEGYDPYDGLNSSLFNSFSFISRNHFARLVWIQFFKRSPVNLRRVAGINKEYNPKALGLFLSGYCKLYNTEPGEAILEKINFFIGKILNSSVPGYSGACWGYNFDWEATVFSQPKNTPTIVVSSFIANSLLDAYEIIRDEKLIATVRSTCDFFLNDLYRTYDDYGNYAFSYSKLDKSVIYNASMLGGRLMIRVYSITGEIKLLDEAKKVMTFCCNRQAGNGSWPYGYLDYQQWIDSFHTGYNLECLATYIKYSGDQSFNENLRMGYDFYIESFFTSEGVPKYYSNSVYPIDIHAPAQLVITVAALEKFLHNKVLIDKVLSWIIRNMQSDKGYFYYQKNWMFKSKIPYMRWSQAWMFYALSVYIYEQKKLSGKVEYFSE